ncbi:Aquaporin [Entamoeba marina]
MELNGPIPNHKPINVILQRASETRERKLQTKQNRKKFNVLIRIWQFFHEALLIWLCCQAIAVALVLYVDLLIFSEYHSPSFNPIATMIYLFLGIMNFFECVWQIIVQCVSVFCCVMFIYYFYDIDGFITVSDVEGNVRFVVSELLGSFFLVLVLMICIHKTIPPQLPLAATIGGSLLIVPAMTVNPAITFGRMFLPGIIGNDPVWGVYYILAQFVGGFLGYLVSSFLMFPTITDPYRHRRISNLSKKQKEYTEDEDIIPLNQLFI